MKAKRQPSFRRTLLAIVTLAAVLPALLAGLPLVTHLLEMERANAERRLSQATIELGRSLASQMDVMAAKLATLARDSDITFGGDSHLLLTRVDQRLDEFIQGNHLASGVYYFNAKGELRTAAPAGLDLQKHLPAQEIIEAWVKQGREQQWLIIQQKAFNQELMHILKNQGRTRHALADNEPVITVVQMVKDFRNVPQGALVLVVPVSMLAQRLGLSLGAGQRALLEVAGVKLWPALSRLQEPIEEIVAEKSVLLGGGHDPIQLTLRMFESAAQHRLPLWQALGQWGALFGFLVLLCALSAHVLARWLLGPLKGISSKVQDYANGHYDTPRPDSRFKEFHRFLDLLEQMAEKIQSQMAEVERRRMRESQLDKAKIEAELQALRFQMNPHFLFNALNSVLAMMDFDSKEASAMLEELAHLYQNIVTASQRGTIAVEEEMAIVRSFVALQKRRFGSRLRFEEQVDSSLAHHQLPGMLIQTLVENAVKHGIEACRDGGEVIVKVSHEKDEGLGIEVLNTGRPLVRRSRPGGTGLSNTLSRLKALYGDAYEFRVFVNQAGKTVAQVKLGELQ